MPRAPDGALGERLEAEGPCIGRRSGSARCEGFAPARRPTQTAVLVSSVTVRNRDFTIGAGHDGRQVPLGAASNSQPNQVRFGLLGDLGNVRCLAPGTALFAQAQI